MTQSRRRVAITGMGITCGLGHNLNEVWNNVIEGKPGISHIEQIDTENLAVKIAGEVKNFQLSNDLLPEKEHARYDRFIHFALHCTDEALKHAGLSKEDWKGYEAEKVGCILGVGMGGFPIIEEQHNTFLERGPRRVSPFFIPAIIPNMASGLVSIQQGLKGINYTVASACASAAHAIGTAADEIMLGRQDVMITGGAESVISDMTITGFANMKALSKRNDDPAASSRPFDTGRDGFVMGEGAGVLILEDYDKAVARGATIYAEVVGHGSSSDAYHITAPHPEGLGASQCMKASLAMANIKPEEIGYINAHGTSTPLGDIGETGAIKKTFGDHAYNLHVSSTKSMTGHLLGAAGGIETIFCAMALHTQTLPPTINLEDQDPNCDLNYVPNQSISKKVDYALNNSFGFGGTNCSLILKKHN
ncbi:MAG: beta-ketoacyl-[acyl-carrier-protein] synthase II [Halobacteriovoraceae bacterium]|jgi:3-oxoacyl-[acyl-carrier-protein] synthase II|nr:beta-ketoacyl-[acyl-carrier-protein] synthase II [Halobacteriovoraceae bacterium]